jgi:Zn-dependent M28 family amino/carboxypeptidase
VRRALCAGIAALAVALVGAPVASAIDRVNTRDLRRGVTLDGILEHERALQDIAIEHDGNRAATTQGYRDSVDYVANRLRRAGYRVTLDPFNFPIWNQNGPATFQRTDVDPDVTYAEGTDYIVAQFSGSADVSGPIFVAGHTELPQPAEAGTSVSGCDPADFNGIPPRAVALVQRGTCPFTQKYTNALEAGAAAVLIWNDGFPDREAPLPTTASFDNTIPAAMISNDIGLALATTQGATVRLAVSATVTPNEEMNVIADSPRGKKDRTIVVGAHLDSVEEGPGINDNGSGSSTILEIAEEIAQLDQRPRNRLRFAFWGAEEAGLVGSTAYVDEQIENGGIDQIEANLNFDMVGSPNFVRFVYDGDLSDSTPPPGGAPNGSGQIERLFTRYFDRQGLETEPTAFDGRSDYGPFITPEAGVPAGGLFTGAEGIKTEEEEAVYGGVAGLAYDPCYHQECDTFFNLSYTALDQMSDGAAHATWTLARSKSPVASATAAKAKKGKKAKRGKAFKFKGHQRVR